MKARLALARRTRCGVARQGKAAFTLIELLVVIAIIAVLASILLPAVQAALDRARTIYCASNLKAQGTALNGFAFDTGEFPGSTRQFDKLDSSLNQDLVAWAPLMLPYLNGNHKVFNCPSEDKIYWWTKEAAGGRGSRSFPHNLRTGLGGTGFCYGYNDWGAGEQAVNATGKTCGLGSHIDGRRGMGPAAQPITMMDIVAPAYMIAITDSKSDNNWDSVTDPSDPGTSQYPAPEWPSRRHKGGSNVLWVDGHVDHRKQIDLTAWRGEVMSLWNNDHLPHRETWGFD